MNNSFLTLTFHQTAATLLYYAMSLHRVSFESNPIMSTKYHCDNFLRHTCINIYIYEYNSFSEQDFFHGKDFYANMSEVISSILIYSFPFNNLGALAKGYVLSLKPTVLI